MLLVECRMQRHLQNDTCAPLQGVEAATPDGSEEAESDESDEDEPAAGAATWAGHSAAPVRDLGPVGWEDPDSAAAPLAAAAPVQGKNMEVVCEIYLVTVCKAVRLATALVLCTTGAVQSLSHFAEKLSHSRPQAAAASAQGGDMWVAVVSRTAASCIARSWPVASFSLQPGCLPWHA